MFDVLIPVLGRPQNAQPVVDSIHEATILPHRILFLCSPGDNEQIEASRDTGAEVIIVSFPPGRSDYPKKMNVGYRETEEEFMVLAADDVEFMTGWDLYVKGIADRKDVGVIGTNDLANRQVMKGFNSTHPVVRRSYITEEGGSLDGPGTLLSEVYDHNFCERELSGLAMARKRWAFIPKAKIKHNHPMTGRSPNDSTYKKGMESFRIDQELFYERARTWGYFGLTPYEKRYVKANRRGMRARTRR